MLGADEDAMNPPLSSRGRKSSTLFMKAASVAVASPSLIESTTDKMSELQSQLAEKQGLVDEMSKKQTELMDKQRTIDTLMDDLRSVICQTNCPSANKYLVYRLFNSTI